MTWVSVVALYFVLWWLVLFAVLPFGLRTQDEEQDVTLGTVSSAPRGPHMLRAVIWTTLASGVVLASFYLLTRYFGYGFEDLPRIAPRWPREVATPLGTDVQPPPGPAVTP